MITKALDHRLILFAIIVAIAALSAALLVQTNVAAQAPECNTSGAGGACPEGAAQSQIGNTVPASVIVTASGLEWVWASPCAQGGSGPCNITIDVGHDGFNFATPAQFALFPFSSFSPSGPCASAWFDFTFNHCDQNDMNAGRYGSAPNGGSPANGGAMGGFHETVLVRDAHVGITLGNSAAIGKLEGKADSHASASASAAAVANLERKADALEMKADGLTGKVDALRGLQDTHDAASASAAAVAILEGKADLLEKKVDDHAAQTGGADDSFKKLVEGLFGVIALLETKLDALEAKSDVLERKADALALSVESIPSHPSNNQGKP